MNLDDAKKSIRNTIERYIEEHQIDLITGDMLIIDINKTLNEVVF